MNTVLALRTGAKDLASSAAYPQDFGDKVAEHHDELVPWMDDGLSFRLQVCGVFAFGDP